jgi:hypothetical protein
MGRRSYFSKTPEFYENFHKMVSNYCIPHEGEPAVSLEMLESYMPEGVDDSEKFMRMFRIISDGLQAQECGIASYEQQVMELN